MVKYKIIFLILVCGLFSCEGDEFISAPKQIVVEGWIDSYGYPVVILTTTAPVETEKQNVSSISDYIVKWAKVTIDDGENQVVLTGKVDEDYFPPYIYTTGDMKGEVGKTYKLTIEYEDFYATAETTIPPPVEIDSFTIKKIGGNSNSYSLTAHFKDDQTEKNYYNFFLNTANSPYQSFSVVPYGLVNDEVVEDSIVSVPIHRDRMIIEWENYQADFLFWEVVKLKFVQMDYEGFLVWKSFEELSTLSRNPLFPVTNGLHSNINGGLGYWLGYGASIYRIRIK